MCESKVMLLANMVIERDRLSLAISGLASDDATRVAIGDWSIKDIIAHLTACEIEATKRLDLLMSGREAEIVLIKEEEVDAWNDKAVTARRHNTWDEVLAELLEAREGLFAALAGVSEEQFALQAGRAPLGSWLPKWTVEHVARHAAELLAWRAEKGL